MKHHEALALLEASADGLLESNEAQALNQHLAECPDCRAAAAALSTFEADLSQALQLRYPENREGIHIVSSRLKTVQAESHRHQNRNVLAWTAGWIMVAAFFIFALSWILVTFIPKPSISSLLTPSPNIIATPIVSVVPSPSTLPTQIAASTPSATTRLTSKLLPKVQFNLGIELSAHSTKAPVYYQELPEPATIDTIRQMANRLGLDAPIYQNQAEGNEPVYTVSDGFRTMIFAYGSSEIFDYVLDYSQVLSKTQSLLPFDQSVALAKSFVDEHALLDSPFQAELDRNQTGTINFLRLLDGRPVIFGIGDNPSLVDLQVSVDMKGVVREVQYAARHYRPAGDFPILSAVEAWQRFLTSPAANRFRFMINDANTTGNFQSWIRPYIPGQKLDLYGYASILQPVEAGGALLAQMNNFPIIGANAQNFASKASPGKFLHAWGLLKPDKQGRLGFDIQGWEISSLDEKILDGKILHQGDQAFLVTDTGQYALPDISNRIADGTAAQVMGVLTKGNTLEWTTMNTGQQAGPNYGILDACGGGGGGGGGGSIGGGAFSPLNLHAAPEGLTPTPQINPAPFKPGDSLDGVNGYIMAIRHRYADGHEAMEIFLRGDPINSFTGYWQVTLSGKDTDGLAQLHNLPVRVWGKVNQIGKDGWPIVALDRYEEAYPGLRIQTWLGKWEPVKVDEKQVLLFTTGMDEFVLGNSIQNGIASAIGVEGDQVIIEGLAVPGKTFGGYAVIDELAGSIVNGVTNLNSYQITANQPGFWDENPTNTGEALQVEGMGTVEKAELIYAAASLQRCGENRESDPEKAPWLYVQPLWRFTGRFEDGRTFEIQVQALPDEYLKNAFPYRN